MTDRTVSSLRRASAAALLMAAACIAQAQENPPLIPPRTDMPVALQPFFKKAREADAIKDRLARCLAMPDLPNNQWPAGLAEAHCHMAYGHHAGLRKVRELLSKKAYAELDAAYRADLDRHFSKDAMSEAIHRSFDHFDGGTESNELTKLWLDNAPESAFALAARGVHFRRAAAKARGGDVIGRTPPANIARMTLLSEMAVDLLEKALKREPKLIAAHEALIGVGRMASMEDVRERAFKRGMEVDKLCSRLTQEHMMSLRPRWGGSYEAMGAYAAQLAPFQKERPLLALTLAAIPADISTWVFEHTQFKEKVELLLPPARQSTDFPIHDVLARSMSSLNLDAWATLQYLYVANRFMDDDLWITRTKGRALLYAGEAEWALLSLERAAELDPTDEATKVMLAHAYYELRRLPEAQTAYVPLLDMKDRREEALRALFDLSMETKQGAKVFEYAELLNKEYPAFDYPWFIRGWAYYKAGKPGAYELLEKYLAVVERDNPHQEKEIAEAKRILAERKKK